MRSASPAPYASAVMTVSTLSPGRSSASRRASSRGSPKCMKRPPLHVPRAVWVGSRMPQLYAANCCGLQRWARARSAQLRPAGCCGAAGSAGGAEGRACPQRRLEALERVAHDLLLRVLLAPGPRRERLRGHTAAELLKLGDANGQILATLAAQL